MLLAIYIFWYILDYSQENSRGGIVQAYSFCDLNFALRNRFSPTTKKMKFSIKDFLNKFGHIYWKNPDRKLHFLCSVPLVLQSD